jgi:nitrogen regulatory protein P-II 1
MKKVEAIVKPSGVDNVAERLRHIGVEGLTVSEIELVDLVPKVRLQIVVNDEMVEQVVAAIRG